VDCTLTDRLSESSAREYDAFVLGSPAGHVAQTRPWAAIARAGAQVKPYFAVLRRDGKIVGTALVLRPVVLGVPLPWAWTERGPVVDDVALLGEVVRALARALRGRGVARLRVMPYWSGANAERAEAVLRSVGLRLVQTPDGPHASTLRLALDVGAAELLGGKNKGQVRWRSRQAERAGATARRGGVPDWERLRELYAGLMEGQGKRDRPDRWWDAVRSFASDDTRGALFACDHHGRTVAACVVLRHGALATYAWGASVPEKLPFSKAILALVAGIRWAREAGATTFDLGGIPEEDDHDPKRAAIATFKHDFDKKRVRLVREHAGWCWR
jgi:lipid II:glycine glycyltransferase (peptidoglycan interpeptide bridge formation enzyme)